MPETQDDLRKRWERVLPAVLGLLDVQRRAAAAGAHASHQIPVHLAARVAGSVARAVEKKHAKGKAAPPAPAKKKGKPFGKSADFGPVDPRKKRSSRLAQGLLHAAGGGAIIPGFGAVAGGIQGARHAGQANALRQRLGGSPVRTPRGLPGRGSRALGAFTGALGGGGLGAMAGMRAAYYGGSMTGSRGKLRLAQTIGGGIAGGVGGGIAGGRSGYRTVRDSQLNRMPSLGKSAGWSAALEDAKARASKGI